MLSELMLGKVLFQARGKLHVVNVEEQCRLHLFTALFSSNFISYALTVVLLI